MHLNYAQLGADVCMHMHSYALIREAHGSSPQLNENTPSGKEFESEASVESGFMGGTPERWKEERLCRDVPATNEENNSLLRKRQLDSF